MTRWMRPAVAGDRAAEDPRWAERLTLMSAAFVFAVLLSCCGCGSEAQVFEASMNFDVESVEPFLNQLENRLQLGLPVAGLVVLTRSTTVDSENARTLSVKYRGVATG